MQTKGLETFPEYHFESKCSNVLMYLFFETSPDTSKAYATRPGNKALSRDYLGMMEVNNALWIS